MSKHKFWLLGTFFILCIVIAILFSPRPILKHPDSARDLVIQYYNYSADSKLLELSDAETEKVVECLSRYKERRTFNRAYTYSLNDVELDITVLFDNGIKSVLLGKQNTTSEGYGTFRFVIINPEALLAELKACITLPPQ